MSNVNGKPTTIPDASGKTFVQPYSVPGLLACEVKYEVKAASGFLEFNGGKLTQEVWQPILAFFKWVNDKWKSEAQVRLYYNQTTKAWFAWAFPQEADTGMAAREIAGDETNRQRACINDDWTLFGTVHSHCDMSAFQSGTDEQNEKAQEGLHITIGYLDKKKFDIHCRFYRQQIKFEPDMSEFWDLGQELVSRAVDCEILFDIKPDLDKVARAQMCVLLAGSTFPKDWELNIIEKPKAAVRVITHHGQYNPHDDDYYRSGAYNGQASAKSPQQRTRGGNPKNEKNDTQEDFKFSRRKRVKAEMEPVAKRAELAMEYVMRQAAACGVKDIEEVDDLLNMIEKDFMIQSILQACKDFNVLPEDLSQEFVWLQHSFAQTLADAEATASSGVNAPEVENETYQAPNTVSDDVTHQTGNGN